MFGWELPPYNSGGLGTACLGLTEGLVPLGTEVAFVLPQVAGKFDFEHMEVLDASRYSSPEAVEAALSLSRQEQASIASTVGYGNQLAQLLGEATQNGRFPYHLPVSPYKKASWYAHQAAAVAAERQFDVVHCHDWMTYYCGIAAKQAAAAQGRQVPFVAHVHATEIDRCGEHGDPEIMAIEKAGLEAADQVVAVSEYTRRLVHRRYGIPLKKISVVYNGIPLEKTPPRFDLHELKKHYKLALFMGRITMQKGPEYFVRLAKAVTDRNPGVKFIMVGSGDMEKRCIEESARLGLTGKLLFSSFLRGQDVNRAYQLADLFIMPSLSEPFGIVALESMQNGTPVLASRQSGVAEVSNAIVTKDFWDIEAMTDTVLELLYHPTKAAELSEAARRDLHQLSWQRSASRLKDLYQQLLPTHAY